jgi:hypothetical protein
MTRGARWWHGAIAVIVLAALALQVWIAIQVPGHPRGHAVGTLRGTAVGWRIGRVASFFTIQSNLLSGISSLLLARDPSRDGRVWRVLRLDALLGITVTGVVYATVLARIHEPHGWQETTTNTALHYVVPLMMVLGWLALGPRPRIRREVLAGALAWPTAYLGYVLVEGRLSRWYPYPFLDVATRGYGHVIVNSLVVVVVLAVVSAVFWLGDSRLPAAPAGS